MVEYIVISKKTKVEPLMDCFSDVFTTFLDLDTFQLRCCLREGQIALGFHLKNILICVLEMNEGLTGLKRVSN